MPLTSGKNQPQITRIGEPMNAETKNPAISRRHLLAGAAGAGVFMIVPRHVLGGGRQTAPSDKINLACVGAGGQAVWDIEQLEKAGARIAFLCDVDLKNAAETFARYPQVPKYRDYR
jgi:hypothetical protein